MTATKRRWFRLAFSLRTLFVVVTVLGIWLGYHVNWIHQRHRVLARADVRSYEQSFLLMLYSPDPPWPLSLFGEQGYADVYLVHLDDERERIANPPEISAPKIRDVPLSVRIPRPKLPTWEQRTDPLLRPDERLELERLRRLFPESTVSIEFR